MAGETAITAVVDPAKAVADPATAVVDPAKAAVDPAAVAVDPAKAVSRDTETPEQKAAREAAEKVAETPEQKVAREAAEKATKKTGAPEAYEPFKLPEGAQPDDARLQAFLPVAKDIGLSQDQAQKLVTFQAEQMQKMATDAIKQSQTAWEALGDTMLADAKKDPEIGGTKFAETVTHAQAFLKEFGDQGLTDVLNQYKLGNNVHVIRALAKAGKLVSEDKMRLGRTGNNGAVMTEEDRAKRFYDKSYPPSA